MTHQTTSHVLGLQLFRIFTCRPLSHFTSPPLTARQSSLLATFRATSNTTIHTANVCLRALINYTRTDSTSTVVHSISEIAHNGLR